MGVVSGALDDLPNTLSNVFTDTGMIVDHT
jgi:hypothetical protein